MIHPIIIDPTGEACFDGLKSLFVESIGHAAALENPKHAGEYKLQELRTYAQISGMPVDKYLKLWFNHFDENHKKEVLAAVAERYKQVELEWQRRQEYGYPKPEPITPGRMEGELSDALRRRKEQSMDTAIDTNVVNAVEPTESQKVAEKIDAAVEFAKFRVQNIGELKKFCHQHMENAVRQLLSNEEFRHGQGRLARAASVNINLDVEWQ